jgi:hypothetical protein
MGDGWSVPYDKALNGLLGLWRVCGRWRLYRASPWMVPWALDGVEMLGSFFNFPPSIKDNIGNPSD